MIPYNTRPLFQMQGSRGPIASFVSPNDLHCDPHTIESFGREWKKFSDFSVAEISKIGDDYFDIVPQGLLTKRTVVLDIGCGSGRWSRYLLDRVGFVEGIDPSEAVFIAQQMNAGKENFRVTHASVANIPFPDSSFDFIICLGVLHHLPGTAEALGKATKKLKSGGYFLLYLYYDLDNRGRTYRALFQGANLIRKGVACLPGRTKELACDLLAILVYMPLISLSRGLRALGLADAAAKVPLDYYHDKSWHVIRNDALDRFGTPLEQRFTREQISRMMNAAGLVDVVFSSRAPFWHCIGRASKAESHAAGAN